MKQIQWQKVFRRIGVAVIAALAATALLTGLLGSLVSNEVLTIDSGEDLACIIGCGALFTACMAVVPAVSQGRLPVAALTAAIYVVLLLVVKVMAFPQCAMAADWRMALLAAAPVAAGILSSRRKIRKK